MSAIARVQMTGFDQQRQLYRDLPVLLAQEAEEHVHVVSELAAEDIRAAYPVGKTGHLRDGVKVEYWGSGTQRGATIRNLAPHALSYETGTKARHTKLGLSRGQMKAGKVFHPRVRRYRRELYGRLQSLLKRARLLAKG